MEITEMLIADFFAIREDDEAVPAGELYSFLLKHNGDPKKVSVETVRKAGREYRTDGDAFVKTERE